jgi:hypothetical protein
MRSLSWLLPWYSAYDSVYRLCILVAYRENEVCGIMPLVESKSTWTGNTLSFMGSGKACTDDCGILCFKEDEHEVAEAIAKWLVSSSNAIRWDHLNLDGVQENNAAMTYFGETMQRSTGTAFVRKASPSCWSASLEGGMEAYKKGLSKRARKILSEAQQELESGRSQLTLAQDLPEAHRHLEEIARLHQMRWKERGIEGCFADDMFTKFLHGTLDSLWNYPFLSERENGKVEETRRVFAVLLKIDQRAASGAICIRDRDALDVYLTGMNPEFSEVRPGWQLLQNCIELACSIGCKRIDFLRGDEEYKARLGALATKQERWVIASPRLSSQIRSAAYRTASSVKAWWTTPAKPNSNWKKETATSGQAVSAG